MNKSAIVKNSQEEQNNAHHKLMQIGEINSERGVAAKRNLFIFCSTILILNYSSSVEFTDINVFGIYPFEVGSNNSWFFISIAMAYFFSYWLYQYIQGWLRWRSTLLGITSYWPLKIFFWRKHTYKDGGGMEHVVSLKETTTDCNIHESWLTSEQAPQTKKQLSFSPQSIKFLRLQVGVFFLGVFILLALSVFTIKIIYSNIAEIENSISQEHLNEREKFTPS